MKKASARQLKEFKRFLNKVIPSDISFLNDETIREVFENNFESNLALAEKVLFHKYDEIKSPEFPITNMEKAVKMFRSAQDKKETVLLITDNDSDGSQAQAAMLAGKNLTSDFDNVFVEYAQNVNKNKSVHGITVEVVEEWFKKHNRSFDENITIMTADNGIQSREEFENILKVFPNSKIIVTDHHLPDEVMTPKESDRLTIVNPKYKPKGFFKDNPDINISGANVLAWFIKNVIRENNPEFNESKFEALDNIEKHSNSMDFVKSILSKYPIKSHEIEENTSIRALMNINNSIKSFIGRDVPESQLKAISELSSEIDTDQIRSAVEKVKVLNHYAKALLSVQKEYISFSKGKRNAINADIFNSMVFDKMLHMDVDNIDQNSINNNYIEQLRPHIFLALSDPNKDQFTKNMYEKMVEVFSDLKKCENKIVNELRKGDLMQVIKEENVTILYPKNFELLNFFGRKLLMKVYNEVNNGLFFAMTNESPESKEGAYKIEGSFRSTTIDSGDVMDFSDDLFKDFGLKLKGHDKAAGAFFESKTPITINKVKKFAEFLNGQVEHYRNALISENSKYNDEDYYVFDTTNLHIAKEINNAIKGSLPNQRSITPLLKLTRSSKFKDKASGKAITVGEMLKKETYGYAIIELNFDGDAAILQTETVRKLAENNFKDYVVLQQIDDSAFIANSIAKSSNMNPERIIKVKSTAKESEKELMEDYLELEKNNYTKKIGRDELKNQEVFKRNVKFGDGEFDRAEEFIISMIDSLDVDQYTVLDVEANGLGRPELFNVGTLDLKIKKDSGIKIPLSEYRDAENKDELKKLIQEKYLNGENIKNVKVVGDQIILNREIEAEMLSLLTRSPDFSILEPISDLTGVSQASINKYGMLVAEADKILYKRYHKTKTAIVIHNAPYDASVLRANTPLMAKYLRDEGIVCDTAPLAKENAIGYADMEVTRFKSVPEALFYDNPYSDFSLSKMIDSEGDFNYPDVRGDFVFKRKNGDYFLIDKKNNVEKSLSHTKEDVESKFALERTPMPRNRVKFGVQFLLKGLSIRNMLLDQIDDKVKLVPATDTVREMGLEEDFIDICDKYNFGGSFAKNFYNYAEKLRLDGREKYEEFIDKVFKSSDKMKEYFSKNENELKKENAKILKEKDKKIKDLIKKENKKHKPENMSSDDFEKFESSLNKKIEEIEEKYDSKIFDFDVLDLLKENVGLFLEENKEIYLKYTNAWEYQALLEVYDPMKKVVSQNDLEKIAYQTSLPEDRIKKMCNEIYDFKKSLGIEKEPFYIPELHNNFNEGGDMVIEHFAIISSLLVHHYNRYSNVMSDMPLKIAYNSYAESHTRFKKNSKFYESEFNSASTKQLQGYNQRQDASGKVHVSDEVTAAKNIHDIILKNRYLQDIMTIRCEKSAQEVYLDDIEEIEEDLNFVLSYNLIANSRVSVIKVDDLLNNFAEKESAEDALRAYYFYELYKFEESDFKDVLSSDEIVKNPDELDKVYRINDLFKFINHYNLENKNMLKEYLEENKEEYMDRYKKVYDKVGYFYVSKSKEEIKMLIDSIHVNTMCNESRINTKVKTLTEANKENIEMMAEEVFDMVGGDLKLSIDEDNKAAMREKLEKMGTINDFLESSIYAAQEIMEDPDRTFDQMRQIMPLILLETKKNDPIKEVLKFSEIRDFIMSKKIKEKLEGEEQEVKIESNKPKSKR